MSYLIFYHTILPVRFGQRRGCIDSAPSFTCLRTYFLDCKDAITYISTHIVSICILQHHFHFALCLRTYDMWHSP